MSSVTPDLLPPAAPLVPHFPLDDSTRPLTLYPGSDGEVRVRWRLRADEHVVHGAGFPSADGAPEVVLRLGRVHTGGSEPIRERRLPLSGLSGSGEVGFQIGDDSGLFEAELGLKNHEGGWLLLARSNRLQQARGLGLESLRPPPPGMDWDLLAESASVDPRSVDPGWLAPKVSAVMTAIPRLNYADPAPVTTTPVIEAELRIYGWSTPNTEIDLFGHRYRVGPGGRFQFSVRIEDLELIRRALERHPLPELDEPRQ
ncbi:MAG: hypothetical protein ACUVQI_11235 [Thermochromatium sp.]